MGSSRLPGPKPGLGHDGGNSEGALRTLRNSGEEEKDEVRELPGGVVGGAWVLFPEGVDPVQDQTRFSSRYDGEDFFCVRGRTEQGENGTDARTTEGTGLLLFSLKMGEMAIHDTWDLALLRHVAKPTDHQIRDRRSLPTLT